MCYILIETNSSLSILGLPKGEKRPGAINNGGKINGVVTRLSKKGKWLTMRDLVFKNLTSKDKSRKVLCAREKISEDGITTRIKKHLIYAIREAADNETAKKITPELFIIKEKNSNQKKESFFIKMKGGMYACCNKKLLHIDFLHSLRIDLTPQEN